MVSFHELCFDSQISRVIGWLQDYERMYDFLNAIGEFLVNPRTKKVINQERDDMLKYLQDLKTERWGVATYSFFS